ncbi:hypothetical protein Daesc_004541 [Daldinia eschscholtzii]|uniref:Aminoglycoside phosphotransferase domain-containing protein n=1 Tax=Daldinia eschscholtzii TaxID=292717 RepID=A0AAX6MPZ9_9PEZI
MASSSSNNSYSDCSGCSDSSTLVWEHEAFNTFQFNVLVFALNNMWPDAELNDIIIERLKGGGYNRIIGFSYEGNGHTNFAEVRYILRLPRLADAQVDRGVAVLHFLEKYTEIPVPRVITFDNTDDNEFESPYMIQNRIPGTGVLSTFPLFDHAEKLRFAHELGDIFRRMLTIRSHAAGSLAFLPGQEDLKAEFCVVPFGSRDTRLAVPYYNTEATAQTVRGLLLSTFQDQIAYTLKHYPTSTLKLETLDKFCSMAWELEARGWFDSIPNCLAHLDLAPRNILVNPTSDPQQPIISAVLDWDSAVLVPQFMACAPPCWIWAWLEDEDEDEKTANDDPPTEEQRQLKKTFEKAAGGKYMRFAYEPAYRLARRLLRFAIDGEIRSNQDLTEAEEMLKEWETIR